MSRSKVSVLAIVLVASLMMSFMPTCADDAQASTSFSVTDGVGRTHTFESLPTKMVTIGAGLTATAIGLGLLDDMIVCDKYSVLDSHNIFDGLRDRVDDGQIKANGSAYSTGIESVKIDIWDMTEAAGLGEDQYVDEIAIFITGLPSSLDPLYEDLTDSRYKYRYVLCWDSIESYDEVIDMVEAMSMVMKGTVDPVIDSMKEVVNYVDTILAGIPGLERREAFYVTYSGGELKVGNIGSLANSMIGAAGGVSITTDPDMAKTYAINIPRLIEEHGTDVVIFVDSVLANNESNMNTLRKALGGQDVMLVKLDPLWNNYCIESMNGVWAMACAMYPDLFEGDVPVMSNDYDDNIVTYAIAGVIGAILIAITAVLYFRK